MTSILFEKFILHHKWHGRIWTLLINSHEKLIFNRIATDDDMKRRKQVLEVELGMNEHKPMKQPKAKN